MRLPRPPPDSSASVAISLLVFNHLSSLELMEHSIKEMGRALKKGGKAVFVIQTMTTRGEILGYLKKMIGNRNPPQSVPPKIREKLLGASQGQKVEFSENEIMKDMLQLEFRRTKSIPLRRAKQALRMGGLHLYRIFRNKKDGATMIAAEKI